MQARQDSLYPRAPFYFFLLLLVALIGFFPSFFGRIGDARPVHLFHGVSASLWMLLLITQSWLIRARNPSLHRVMGRASVLVALAFVASGLLITHDMLTRGGGFATAFGPRLLFTDLVSVLWFAFAVSMAIRHRRNMQLHARYMVSTALPLLPPALARLLGMHVLPAGSGFGMAFHLASLAALLVVLALLLDDHRRGKVYAPYALLLVVLLLQQASYEVMHTMAWWGQLVTLMRAL